MEVVPANALPAKRTFQFRVCLGRGGFGEVYLATMKSSGGVETDVAVKVLHAGLDPRSQAIGRLKDEGKLLGQLNHPSILRVNDLVVLEGRVSLVTEYVEGADLDGCLKAGLPPRALVEVIGRVADALDAAYNTKTTAGDGLHLIHRDIKPANIRIGRHGDVKLLDFGIARATNVEREVKTQTNALIGSSLYMAPERLDDQIQVDTPSDVFSLGCTLYEGLSGQRFYKDLSIRQQYLMALVRDKYEEWLAERLQPIREHHAKVLPLLVEMLCYKPDERPAAVAVSRRCDEMAEALEGATLRRWCKDRDWPEACDVGEGAFTGRTVSEATQSGVHPALAGTPAVDDTLNRSRDDLTADPDAPTAEASKASLGLWLVAAGLGLLATSLALATSAVLYLNGSFETPSQEVPAALASPAEDEGTKGTTADVETPRPEVPPPVAPMAVETPPSAPAAAPTAPTKPVATNGTWSLSAKTKVPVELRGPGGTHGPGRVPAGTYEVWADFGAGLKRAGSANVTAGGAVVVACSRLRQDCGPE